MTAKNPKIRCLNEDFISEKKRGRGERENAAHFALIYFIAAKWRQHPPPPLPLPPRSRRRSASASTFSTKSGRGPSPPTHSPRSSAPLYSNGRIDVELALDVCRHASNGSNGSTASTRAANLQQTFRLFDIDDKGIITLDNLRKVADEIYGSETNTESSSSSRKSSIDDDLLKSMIETFDGDLTDGISFEEFCRIMDR